jgi:transposase
VPDVPGVPCADELSALPRAELAERLAEAYRLIAELTGQAQRLQARVEELERQVRGDSSNSSRPPSSDSPYRKKPRDRLLWERGKRRPGKQPGEPGTTMELVDDRDERVEYASACCRDCGAGLAGEPVLSQRRYQVTEIGPAPPTVTEHLAQPKWCPCCGTVNEPVLAQHVRARAVTGRRCMRRPRTWSAAFTCPLRGRRSCWPGWPASPSRPGGWPRSAARQPRGSGPAGSSGGYGTALQPGQ